MLHISDFESGREAIVCSNLVQSWFVFPEFAIINNFFSTGNVSASRYHQPKTLIQSGPIICKLYKTSRLPEELLIKGGNSKWFDLTIVVLFSTTNWELTDHELADTIPKSPKYQMNAALSN